MLFILPCESKLPKCHFLLVLRTGRSASNGFSQSLTENVFSSSFLVDSFAAYRILGWQFSSVYILSFNSLLVSTVSGDRSAVIEWMLPYTGGVVFLLLLPRFSLFLWLTTAWLCTGMERSAFMLLEVCWDSWMSFSSNTFLAIISLNGFFVCVAPTMAATLG